MLRGSGSRGFRGLGFRVGALSGLCRVKDLRWEGGLLRLKSLGVSV